MGSIKRRTLSDGKTVVYDARLHRRVGIQKNEDGERALPGEKKKGGDGTLSRTFKTMDEARVWVNETENRIDKGGAISRKAEKIDFEMAADKYVKEAKPFSRKQKVLTPGEIQTIKSLKNDWKIKISEITNARIQEWIDQFLKTPVAQQDHTKKHPYYNGGLDPKTGKRKTYSESTVRRFFFQLKKVLTWTAVKENIELNPNLFKVKIPRAWAGKRRRRLEPGEWEKIKESANRGYEHKEEWPLLAEFAIETAARLQEILKCQWEHLRVEQRTFEIPEDHTKTGAARIVPLSTRALEIIKEMEKRKKTDEERVWHMWRDSQTVSKGWRRLVVRAKIDNLTFHDLRHEGISRFYQKTDLTDTEVASISGHSKLEMLKYYSVLRPSQLARRLDGERR
jgi:integrase